MKSSNRDYTKLTEIASSLGLFPYYNRAGQLKPGFYAIEGKEAPIDLTACAEDERSILRTALQQLSEQVDSDHWSKLEE